MGICREKDIGVYFGIFCQGKVYPGVWEEVESVMECRDGK